MKKILFILIGIAGAGILIAVILNTGPEQDQNGVVPLTAEEEQQIAIDKAAVSTSGKASRYTHPRLGFSFIKPEGYTVGSIKDEDGSETLVVQPKTNIAKNGFQIYITPLDAPMELTPDLVKKDLPDTLVSNPQKIELDGKGKGMMFVSNNEAYGGKSFEIWFVSDLTLYQVSSYGEFAGQLQQIIGTWKFN